MKIPPLMVGVRKTVSVPAGLPAGTVLVYIVCTGEVIFRTTVGKYYEKNIRNFHAQSYRRFFESQ